MKNLKNNHKCNKTLNNKQSKENKFNKNRLFSQMSFQININKYSNNSNNSRKISTLLLLLFNLEVKMNSSKIQINL